MYVVVKYYDLLKKKKQIDIKQSQLTENTIE